MPNIAYTVAATFPDQATMHEYIAWLEDGHIDHVIARGAHSATIIRLDRIAPTDPRAATDPRAPTDPHRVEVRYIFTSRDALDRYLTNHAPALRAQGLARFPPEKNITFTRSTGEIL